MKNIEIIFLNFIYPIIILTIFPQIAWILSKKLDNNQNPPSPLPNPAPAAPLPNPAPAENPFKCAGFWFANSIIWGTTLISIIIAVKLKKG